MKKYFAHNQLNRKRKAIIDDALPTMIFLMMMAVCIFVFIGYNRTVNQKTALNNIARQYLLEMETSGYMTRELEENLIKDLNASGFRYADGSEITIDNIDLAGTTFVDPGYGNRIQITISVYTINNALVTTTTSSDGTETKNFDLFHPLFHNGYEKVSVTYVSTSKKW